MRNKTQLPDSFCSQRLKVISDPTRWLVVVQLLGGAKNVGELNAELRMDLTLLSHHLKILRQEGFVQFIREGKKRLYSLGPKVRLTPTGRGIDLGCCQLELDRAFPIKGRTVKAAR